MLIALDLEPNSFVPSSLRTGGASFLFEDSGENMNLVMWRGRWNSPKMLNVYVQELRAALVTLSAVNPKVRRMAELLEQLM